MEEQDDGRRRKVVSHTFHGADRTEAEHNLRAHRKADHSLDAALKGRPYKGVRIEARRVGRKGSR